MSIIGEMYEDTILPPLYEEIKIYNDFLIQLHTARWTGNNTRFAELMENLSAYSYARTNGFEGITDKEEKDMLKRTLKNLTK